MERTFHVFEGPTATGDIPVGLIEDGVPKAMAVISSDLYPPLDEDMAYALSKAIINAFGQEYPVPEDKRDVPWL